MLGCRYAPMVCAFSSKQIGEYHRLGRQSLIMSSTSDLTDNNPSRNIIRNILMYIYTVYIYNVHIMISIFLIISPCHTSWPSSCCQSWLALYFFSGFPKAHQRSGSGCLRRGGQDHHHGSVEGHEGRYRPDVATSDGCCCCCCCYYYCCCCGCCCCCCCCCRVVVVVVVVVAVVVVVVVGSPTNHSEDSILNRYSYASSGKQEGFSCFFGWKALRSNLKMVLKQLAKS